MRLGLGLGLGVISGSSGPAFSPTQIAGMTLWLSNAGLASTGGFVTSWADASGAGIITTMNQSTSAPTYTASGINGKPDALGTSGITGLWAANGTALGSTGLTLATCVSRATANVARVLGGARFNAHHYTLEVDATNGGQALFRLNTSVSGVVLIKSDSLTILSDGAAHRIIGTWDGATMKMYVDGVLQTQTAACTGTIIAPSTNSDFNSVMCNVGSTNSPSLGFDGHMTDWMTYNSGLSATNVAKLDTFLAAQ